MRKTIFVGLTLMMLLTPGAMAAAESTKEYGVPEVGSAGWVEEAISLALDVAFDVAGIGYTAAKSTCEAATSSCPL